jgi:hypothetical protein
MNESRRVLLLEGSDADTASLAVRVHELGIQPVRAESLEDAVRLVGAHAPPIDAALLPSEWPASRVKDDVKSLRRAIPGGALVFVVYGKPLEKSARKQLRAAGVELALWEPFDDGTLRFQLNRSFDGGRVHECRRAERVPTYLLARVLPRGGDGRARDTVVYSLSITGAFIETPRARMGGAEVDLELRLPGRPVTVRAEVVFTNLPGNLQRENLPLGMGVRFLELPPETEGILQDYLKERSAALLV